MDAAYGNLRLTGLIRAYRMTQWAKPPAERARLSFVIARWLWDLHHVHAALRYANEAQGLLMATGEPSPLQQAIEIWIAERSSTQAA